MSINKKWYKSKTMWAAIVTSLVSHIIPDTKEVISTNPEVTMTIVGFIFGLLRIKTDKPVGK